jgi:hypothetical protein
MKPPAISRFRRTNDSRQRERGITMVLVAIAMVAIIAMAALSIDIITLYLAREEAQRSADQAALAAARVISISGVTSNPNNTSPSFSWGLVCGGSSSPATLAAVAVATQSEGGGTAASPPTVTYSAAGVTNPDCSTLPAAFGVNPLVNVQLTLANLPTFFSRIWGNTGNTVTATATAEVFNPSASDLPGNTNGGPTGNVTPVLPSCVKPWVVPNTDPLNPKNIANCGAHCVPFVSTTDGSIQNPGISLNGVGTTGVIGETFWLVLDCQHGNSNYCQLRGTGQQPEANYNSGAASVERPPNLLYVPGQVGTTQVAATPSCALGDPYEEAIGGCDSPANYQCGVPPPAGNNVVDMSRNPDTSGATTNGVQCLIHQTDPTDKTEASGQDYLNAYAAPGSYPFQILAGTGNPLGPSLAGSPISSSNSIATLPIYDNGTIAAPININNAGTTTDVTFVGFLQVFINAVDQYGNVNVTVLNVAGCGNGTTPLSFPVTGSSPVPIRLVTPP